MKSSCTHRLALTLALSLATLLALFGSATASSPAGPVADFEPVDAVFAHARLRELAPSLDKLLRSLMGSRYVVVAADPCGADPGVRCDQWPKDGMMIWARDYHPLPVRRDDGSLRLISFVSPNPNRTAYATGTLSGLAPVRELTSLGLAKFESLPLLHESGNLITNGRQVFVSDLLLDVNRNPPAFFDPKGTGFTRRTADVLLPMLAQSLGRAPEDLIVLPPMPGDVSRHVDIYLMAIDAETLLVPQIRAEAILASALGQERSVAFQAASFLDGIAARLQARGLIVERLPMAGPMVIPARGTPGATQIVYATPTNGLLLSLPRAKHVLLPVVHTAGRSAAFERLRKGYERTWAEFFRKRGFTPHLVEVGGLAERGGLIHCATATLPARNGFGATGSLHAQNGTQVR